MQKNELGAGHRGGGEEGKRPNPQTKNAPKTTTQPQQNPDRQQGEKMACTGIATGGDRGGENYFSLSQLLKAKTCSNSRQEPPASCTQAQEGGRKARQPEVRMEAQRRSSERVTSAAGWPSTNRQPATHKTHNTKQPQTPAPRPPCNRPPLPKGGERETSWSKKTTNVVAERCRKTN